MPGPPNSNRIKASHDFTLDLEIRSGFRSIDGIIYTLQEFPVARHSIRHGNTFYSGFDLFARHFLIKKLEDAFISAEYYSYPHIPRPLGSEGKSYYTEWVFGFPKCPKKLVFLDKPSVKGVEGLDNWYIFCNLFAEAGIDMRNKMRYNLNEKDPSIQYSNQILIRHPVQQDNPAYLSRLWTRVSFDEQATPIDFEILEKYLISKEQFLKKNLTVTFGNRWMIKYQVVQFRSTHFQGLI